ncbi:hypothetical protein BT96DRAFT_978587 [Gymnopus androsaceus JB14]|uniref:Uncharacterized protein n=1 Tax=Gymnopus androsaceus JB14 TaxID=1447944 RepID=A0A6A4HAL6_9AGAR|nr:hypothetical protein BT96DRAFT_978587 [Gymnopus androsaceus JB14]
MVLLSSSGEIHKANIRPGFGNFASLELCASASKSYLGLIEAQHQRRDCIILSNLIFIKYSYWEKEMVVVHKCLYFLTIYERRATLAIVSSSELSPPPEQSFLKHGRIRDSLGEHKEKSKDRGLYTTHLSIMPPLGNNHHFT